MFSKHDELHGLQYNCHHLLTHASHSGVDREFDKIRHPAELYKCVLLTFHYFHCFVYFQTMEDVLLWKILNFSF